MSIAVERIVFARAADDYAELHLEDGTVHLSEHSLGTLVDLLPARFGRIHRSYLVDLERVQALRASPGSRLDAVLATGGTLPVGRRYREIVRARLGAAER